MIKEVSLLFFMFFSINIGFTQEIEVLINEGHELIVNAAIFSEDDNTLFTAGSDNKIIEWNADLLKQKKTYNGHKAAVKVLAYDEINLYSGGIYELFRWSEEGKVERNYKINGSLNSLHLSGSHMIATTKDQVLLYDVNNVFPLSRMDDITGIQCATLVDSSILAIATKKEIYIVNFITNTILQNDKLNTIDRIMDIDFDGYNSEIVVTGQNFGYRFNLKSGNFLESTEPYFISSTVIGASTITFNNEERSLKSYSKTLGTPLPNSNGAISDKLIANHEGNRILLYGYGSMQIYDLKHQRFVKDFKSERLSLQKFSHIDEQIALGVGSRGETRIFDFKKMMFTSFVKENNEAVTATQITKDELYISSYDDVFSIITPSNMRKIDQFNSSDVSVGVPENYIKKSRYQKLADGFSPDKVHNILKNSNEEIYLVYNSEIRLFKVPKKQFIRTYKNGHSDLITQIIKLDQNTFATSGLDKKLVVWNKNTANQVAEIQFNQRIISIHSAQNNSVKIYLSSGSVMLFNYITKSIEEIGDINSNIQLLDQSAEGKLIYSYGTELTLGTKTHQNTSEILQLKFINSEKLITRHADNNLKIWDFNKGLIATIIATKEGQIIYTPDGYYWGDKKSVNQIIHFKYHDRIYLFNQFDIYFNRPDIILKRIGLAEPSFIKIYESAYEKRAQLTGQSVLDFKHIPNFHHSLKDTENGHTIIIEEVQLNNTSNIEIYINEVLFKGAIKQTNSVTEIYIPKSKIDLNIEVILKNKNGVKSLPKTIYIYAESEEIPSKKHIILLSSSTFKNQKYNLKYPSKDVSDIKNFYTSNFNVEELKFYPLEDEQLTLKNIKDIKNKINSANPFNDEVIIYYAGHGILNEELDYYLSCGQTDFKNPSDSSIKFADLQKILAEITVLKKVLFIDACHSGEFDKQEVELSVVKTESNEELVFRAENTFNYSIPTSSTFELTKAIFNDVREKSGLTIISSASGDEYALESDRWNNGLFTYTLLKGLNNFEADINNDNSINLSEILLYCSENTYKLSNGLQQPSVRVINEEMNFSLISR